MNRKYIIILFCFIASLISYIVLNLTVPNDPNYSICKEYDQIIKKEIRGTVDSKFLDRENHNYKMVTINNTNFDIELDKSGLYKYIEIGDSIYKAEFDSVFNVFRYDNQKQIILKFDCKK